MERTGLGRHLNAIEAFRVIDQASVLANLKQWVGDEQNMAKDHGR